jgi:hypothetical protein
VARAFISEVPGSPAPSGTAVATRQHTGAAVYLGGTWRRMASVSVVRNALASRLRT